MPHRVEENGAIYSSIKMPSGTGDMDKAVRSTIFRIMLTTLAASIGEIGAYRGPMWLGCESGRSGSRRTPWECSGQC